jgi:hypothetical protein
MYSSGFRMQIGCVIVIEATLRSLKQSYSAPFFWRSCRFRALWHDRLAHDPEGSIVLSTQQISDDFVASASEGSVST